MIGIIARNPKTWYNGGTKSIGGHKDVEVYTALADSDNLPADSCRLETRLLVVQRDSLHDRVDIRTGGGVSCADGNIHIVLRFNKLRDRTSGCRADCQPVWNSDACVEGRDAR